MSSRSESRSVKAESKRIMAEAMGALKDGDIGIDEFDALGQLTDGAESAFLEGSISKQKALEALHQAERRLQRML